MRKIQHVFKLTRMEVLLLAPNYFNRYVSPGSPWRMCLTRSSWWMWWTVRTNSTCPCWDVLSSASPSPRSTAGLWPSTANVSSWMLTHLWVHWPNIMLTAPRHCVHFSVIVSDYSDIGFCDSQSWWKWVQSMCCFHPIILSPLGVDTTTGQWRSQTIFIEVARLR